MKLSTPQRVTNNDTDERPDRPSLRRPPTGGERTQAMAAAMADQAETHLRLIGAIGDLTGALQAMTPDVIGVQTIVLDANGAGTAQYRLPFGSLFVDSFSASTLTVAAMPLQSGAPNSGPGVALVRPGGYVAVNFRAYVWSVYGGSPGERVTVSAFARPQAPAAGNGPHSNPGQVVTTAAPALGANLTYTLTTPARLVSLCATYTAGAPAGTRFPQVAITSAGGSLITSIGWSNGIAPSTADEAFIAIGSEAAPTSQFTSWMPMPDLGVLPAGTVISMAALNGADQITAATLLLQSSV